MDSNIVTVSLDYGVCSWLLTVSQCYFKFLSCHILFCDFKVALGSKLSSSLSETTGNGTSSQDKSMNSSMESRLSKRSTRATSSLVEKPTEEPVDSEPTSVVQKGNTETYKSAEQEERYEVTLGDTVTQKFKVTRQTVEQICGKQSDRCSMILTGM